MFCVFVISLWVSNEYFFVLSAKKRTVLLLGDLSEVVAVTMKAWPDHFALFEICNFTLKRKGKQRSCFAVLHQKVSRTDVAEP